MIYARKSEEIFPTKRTSNCLKIISDMFISPWKASTPILIFTINSDRIFMKPSHHAGRVFISLNFTAEEPKSQLSWKNNNKFHQFWKEPNKQNKLNILNLISPNLKNKQSNSPQSTPQILTPRSYEWMTMSSYIPLVNGYPGTMLIIVCFLRLSQWVGKYQIWP